MKKLLILSAILVSITHAWAQSDVWLIEAGGAYKHINIAENGPSGFSEPLSLKDWNVIGNIGCKVKNNVSLGVTVGYGQKDYVDFSSSYYTGQTTTAIIWSAGVWGRYSYTVNSWLFIYSQLNISKFTVDTKVVKEFNQAPVAIPSDYYGTPLRSDGFTGNLYPAVGFNIVNGFGIDISMGGIEYSSNKPTGITDKELNITIGQQFRFGLHKFIRSTPKEKKKPTE